MDKLIVMIKDLLANDSVQSFLSKYPEEEWSRCLEALTNFSISVINKKYPFGLTLEQLFSVGGLSEHKPSSVKKRSGPSGKTRAMSSSESMVSESVQTDSRHKRRSRKVCPNHTRGVIEPRLCFEDEISSIKAPKKIPLRKSSSKIIRLAEDFLKNPFTKTISQNVNKT